MFFWCSTVLQGFLSYLLSFASKNVLFLNFFRIFHLIILAVIQTSEMIFIRKINKNLKQLKISSFFHFKTENLGKDKFSTVL